MTRAEYLDTLPNSLVELFEQAERDILADMARRISEYDYWIPAAEHQRQRLRAMGSSQRYIVKRLSELTGKSREEIKELMQEAYENALEEDKAYYRKYGISVPDKISDAMKKELNAGFRGTNKLFRNLTRTKAVQSEFTAALDRAYLQINTGTFSYDTAVRNAVKLVAKTGLRIRYSSGHQDTIEVAVRRALVTGINQTSGRMQLQLASEVGCDLVEVTAHAGARPSHAVWQGGIYSISGKHPKYRSLEKATGYGTGEGLCGWNCRHSFHPYVEGAPRAYSASLIEQYDAKNITYNGKRYTEYEASQIQRYYERQIRRWKREYASMQAARQDTYESSAKIKLWQDRQKDFVKQTGLKRQNAREQIAEYGKSEARKVGASVEKYSKIRYHKDGTIVVTDDWKSKGKVSIPKKYRPNAVIETQTEYRGGTVQIDRTIYNSDGIMTTQIHSGPHNRSDMHRLGEHGEHSHDYIWSENGKHPNRAPREMTEQERIEHSDLLKGDYDERE